MESPANIIRWAMFLLSLLITLTIVVAVMALILGGLRCHPYYQYTKIKCVRIPEKPLLYDSLRVAFIGDSWANYHHDFDTVLQNLLVKDSLVIAVKSRGNVGAKSKEIYERLSSTTKSILEWHPDYCIISAGINDTVAKLGPDFYVYHYSLIIRQFLNVGVKPIVLEMPEVNYRAIVNRESVFMRIRHSISAFITDSEMYSFSQYRTALSSFITSNGLNDSILYISAESWNPMGFRDKRKLYLPDETHLNAKGYHLLDSCLASEIIMDKML